MSRLIVPLTKSPHRKGRVGPPNKQDWYQGLVKAKQLLRSNPNGRIAIVSNFRADGDEKETDIYARVLLSLGVDPGEMIIVSEGLETVSMIQAALKTAEQIHATPIFVSAFLHYPRVRWLTRRLRCKHYVSWGIPRPKEAITDVILAVLFPVIDLLGKREWFLNRVEKRRKGGKL